MSGISNYLNIYNHINRIGNKDESNWKYKINFFINTPLGIPFFLSSLKKIL